jgi:hypothetical protein
MCIGFRVIGYFFELMNKYRYQLFNKRIGNDTSLKKVKRSMFGSICKNLTDNYSKFIAKHMMNDNFLQIFKIYYPDCMMNKTRINHVVYKYLYDLDASSHITIDNYYIDEMINRFVDQYIMTNNNLIPSDNGMLIDPTDLSNMPVNKSFIKIVYDHLKYLVFCLKMYRKGYVKHDIGPWIYSNIRLWINKTNMNNSKNCIIVDEMTVPIENDDNIYIEIKGFTNYSELFDAITMDMFNTYPKIIDITKQFGALIDQYFKNTKMNIYAQNISTIVIPFFVNHYEETIEKIIVTNPIYYPYTYTMFFDNMCKITDMNPNLLMMLNRLALIDIYYDFTKLDKSINKLYRNCVEIKFDKKLCEKICINNDNLSMHMDMYSECVVKNVELNTYCINNSA